MSTLSPRRVVIGTNSTGASTVLADETITHSIQRPNEAVVHELWRESVLPASTVISLPRSPEFELDPPIHGAVVRLYTLPPEKGHQSPPAGLHRSSASFVITVISGRVTVELDQGEVLLAQGDTMVLPGCSHDLRNPFDAPAQLLYTGFALRDQ